MQIQSRTDLLAENQRLKSRVAALEARVTVPISIDPDQGRVSVTDYRTDQFVINELEATSVGIKDLSSTMSQIDQWIKPEEQREFPDVSEELQKPISVERLKVSVPFKTVNAALPQIAGAQLKEAGVSEIAFSAGSQPGEIAIKGRAKKLIDVKFEAVGDISVTSSGQPKFRLKESRVAGLAMPNFLTSIAAFILAGESMKELGVSQVGDDFIVDPEKILPPNIDAKLAGISITNQGFVIQVGQPKSPL